jgi:hypothetical protein
MGPVLVAALISKIGRTAAFSMSTAGWIPCGLMLMATGLTLEKDEAAMQWRLRNSLSRVWAVELDSEGEEAVGGSIMEVEMRRENGGVGFAETLPVEAMNGSRKAAAAQLGSVVLVKVDDFPCTSPAPLKTSSDVT